MLALNLPLIFNTECTERCQQQVLAEKIGLHFCVDQILGCIGCNLFESLVGHRLDSVNNLLCGLYRLNNKLLK